MELEWITRLGHKGSRHGSNSDVSIYMVKQGQGRERVNFRFANNSSWTISKTGYIKFAVVNGRLYFGEATENEGYKITSMNENKSTGYIRVQEEILPISKNKIEIGDYKLGFDIENKLYYVGIETKIA